MEYRLEEPNISSSSSSTPFQSITNSSYNIFFRSENHIIAMSSSKRKSRREMSDSDEYSTKNHKDLKRKQTHKAHYQDSENSSRKNHKKSKRSSRRDDSFEDSGRESDAKIEHKSSKNHSKPRTRDEKYEKEQRNYETDDYVSHKRNVDKRKLDFESRINDSKSRNKYDDTRSSESVKEVDKRKDKYRDNENKYQKDILSFRETELMNKERDSYQEKDKRRDYQEKEKRSDHQEKEKRRDHQEKRRDYQEIEKKYQNSDKDLQSSKPKRKQRSEYDELPVSRKENRCQDDMDKTLQDHWKDSESVSAVLEESPKKVDDVEPLSKRQKIGNINIRTGGAYIPPARLRMMQEQIQDKGSEEYQRIAWEALKKSIVGMTNKVNSSNIGEIVPELFKENIIRGRGVLSRAIMQAQSASPTFTRVYAALVAIINTKFPEIGELILKRLIIQYKRGFRRNDKTICMTAARFIAHLLNQEVAHEVLILEMVTHLLENPTEDSVEVAIATLKECGKKLTELTARGIRAITQRVRDVLHEGQMSDRVKYMIEVFFAVQKDGFKDFEIIPKELDLIEEDDKYTHLINLDDAIDGQDLLNVFKFDSLYVENEEKYKAVAKEILEGASDSEDSGDESDDEEEENEETKDDESQQIIDMTETNVVCLRRKIYLTVQSSLDFEECAHKLLKLELKPGQILEMCYMILDCCAQQRTYEKFFGLLAQRFCQLSKIYVEPFTEIFENSYKTIHRLETNKLRNVAKFFAHLLYTDAISWMVLANIKLNEEDTTSSSRIFIKILFQELCEYMGLSKLNDRVKDITLQEAFDGLFPRDHPHNTRFAINFFTSIGLGGLTDELREHLKNLPKNPPLIDSKVETSPKESSSDSSSSSSTSSSSSSTSDSSSSDSDNRKSKRKSKQPTRRK